MKFARGDGIETKIELVLPTKFKAGLGYRVVAILRAGMTLREVGCMGRNLVGDHAVLNVFFIRQSEMLLRRDVAEHRATIPSDHRRTDSACDVVVARSDIRRERPERVKWSLMAPFKLLRHVFLNHVHGHVTRTLVHDLHPLGPSAISEFPLHLQFPKLRLVVSVSDRAGPQPISNTEAYVVGRHDVTDVIPMRVEEIFFVMREAPLCHNATATRNNTRHAARRERHKAQENSGVNREVVHPLLGLFDECVAEDFPCQILSLSADLFQRLIDGNSADRHWRIAKNPFTRGVDVFSGGKIHHGIGAPLRGPAHLLDFLINARCHGAVADICVDFH